jgi:hypothetical protein
MSSNGAGVQVKFTIPDTIYILGVLHTVEVRPFSESDADEADTMGLYKPDGRQILIDASQPRHLHPEIFYHEITEAVNSICDLNLKHHQICAMGLGFHDVLNQLEAE